MTSYARARVVLEGNFGTGLPSWSYGFTLAGGAAASSNADVSTLLQNIRTALNTGGLGAALMAAAGSAASLNQLSGYWYPAAATSALYQAQIPCGPFNSTGRPNNAPQLSVVTTLMTGQSGRHNRGRVYLPGNGADYTSCVMTTPSTATVAGAVQDLIQAMNGALPLGATVVVPSSTASVPPVVTDVRVDNAVDTQRRRRDSLVPTSTTQLTI